MDERPNSPEHDLPAPDDGVPIDVPFEAEPMEVEQPRRAASAQFVVDTEVGSAAALREAMDPANQSLADALHLSYRVLQVVILALVALFLVSGFETVDKGQSGVMLRFGKIVAVGEQEALEPGLHHNILPFPAGEFVIFNVENRVVDLGNTYWPSIPDGVTLEQAIDRASPRGALKPGEHGSVITAEGDLAHLKVAGVYEISDPVKFVERLDDAREADRIVQLAIQRAAVHTSADSTLQQLVDEPVDSEALIRQRAQRILDNLDCGVTLVEVQLADNKPPLAIVKVYGELQNAREEARRESERARQDAQQTLIDAAGPNYRALARLIERFEEAQELGDENRSHELLAQINAFLESEEARGQVSEILLRAVAYESEIQRSLGVEANRFAGVLADYRKHPELVTRREWLATFNSVVSRKDAEIFYVPPGLGRIGLLIRGLEQVQKVRRREDLKRRELEANQEAGEILGTYYRRAQDYELDQAQPLLEVGPDGRVRPKGSGR